MQKEVVLVRHGETDWNAQQRWQGHSDVPLNAQGIRQAEEVAEELRPYDLEVLLSSDLARAHQTAQIIARRKTVPIVTSDKLREVHVGKAEGLGYREALDRFGPESILRWRSLLDSDLEFSFPEGETKLDALKRALGAMGEFLQDLDATRVGIVSHGMLIRTFLHYLFPQLELPTVLPNCGYVSLTYEMSARHWSLSDNGHSGEDDLLALTTRRLSM